jgi:hypothetical protein
VSVPTTVVGKRGKDQADKGIAEAIFLIESSTQKQIAHGGRAANLNCGDTDALSSWKPTA